MLNLTKCKRNNACKVPKSVRVTPFYSTGWPHPAFHVDPLLHVTSVVSVITVVSGVVLIVF